jgi:hypothetical protein
MPTDPRVQNATHYPADIGKPVEHANGKQREEAKAEDADADEPSPSSDDEARDVDAEIEDMMDDY